VQLFVGTSGYSYKEWKGSFYPADLAPDGFLAYYAGRLTAVEINNTFYRMPRSHVVESWAGAVPDGFRFVIKANQRITHRARLENAEEPLGFLVRAVRHLGDRQGPVLFQLPPNMKADCGRLAAFLALLPDDFQAAFEFRHASWFTDETCDVLRAAGAALVTADGEGQAAGALVSTADWGYVRLRRADYDEAAIDAWAQRLAAQDWREAWVFLKHEDGGEAPRLAQRLQA
jgi:uncharacterized protein YecE (DUF72 family)